MKTNGSFSMWRETAIGVPQDSVLGQMLFTIYIKTLKSVTMQMIRQFMPMTAIVEHNALKLQNGFLTTA